MWTCKHCGEEVTGHFVECSSCGYVKNWSPPPSQPEAVAPEAIVTDISSRDSDQTDSSFSNWHIVSGLAILGAIVFTGVGLNTLYNDSYSAKIVGGDAYNFIIYATRGTAFVCAGIVCAVLSVTFAIFGHTARKNR